MVKGLCAQALFVTMINLKFSESLPPSKADTKYPTLLATKTRAISSYVADNLFFRSGKAGPAISKYNP